MKIIDLSTLIYTDMEIFPGDPDVKINLVHTYKKNSWELRQLSMGSHTGTHVDAFSHMHEGKESLDKIPIERFCGKGQVVDPSDHWPTDIGLFFIEEIGIEYLERLIIVNPGSSIMTLILYALSSLLIKSFASLKYLSSQTIGWFT